MDDVPWTFDGDSLHYETDGNIAQTRADLKSLSKALPTLEVACVTLILQTKRSVWGEYLIRAIAANAGITELHILGGNYEIGSWVLEMLAGMPKLRYLAIIGCDGKWGDFSALPLYPELQELWLEDIDTQGVMSIAKMTELRVLKLDGTTIGDSGLLHIAGMKNLSVLTVVRHEESRCDERCTAAGLFALASSPVLSKLYVDTHDSDTLPEPLDEFQKYVLDHSFDTMEIDQSDEV
jgi:hypothetical protein